MNNKRFASAALLAALLTASGAALALTCTSNANGNWSAAGTWTGCGGGVPGAADDVIITNGRTVTVNVASAANSITFAANTGATNLTHNAGISLTVGAGGVTINGSTTANSTHAWNINAGSATVNGPVTLVGGNGNTRIARINLMTGTLDINGNLTMTTTTSSARTVIAATGAANIFVSGNFALTNGLGTLTPGTTSTFTYDTATAATVATGAAIQYRNLTINKAGGTATGAATGSLTVLGALTVTAGTLSVSNTVAVTGATSVSGTFANTTATGTKTFTGGVTINAGGTFSNNTVVEPVTIGGNFNNSGTFNSGTGTYTFNSAGQWGGGNPIAFGGAVTVSAARTVNTPVSVTGALSVTAGGLTNNSTLNTTGTFAISAANTITNNGTVTAAGAITGANATTSIWTNAANSTLNVSGALLATGTLNASANPNTVNYAGAAQTVKLPSGAPATYYNLTFSGSGIKTLPATAMTISNDFTLSGTATATAAQALTIGRNFTIGASNTFSAATFAHSIGGNFTQDGTFNANTSTFTFNGTAAQTLGGTATNTTFANLTMSNTAAFASRTLTISHDVTVSTLLTFNAAANAGGRIVTSGAAKVVIPSTGNITNASGSATESDFIAGRLQRFVAAGASTVAFPVGTDGAALPAAGYTPASLTFAGVAAGGGSLIVYVGTPLGDHPNIATSGLDANKSVNRWWALTTTGVTGAALPAFTNYSATFTFIAGVTPAGDLDSGANTANFEIERWNGSAWNTTMAGARTGTTTQATAITALGEFAVAEKVAVIPPSGDFNAFETATAGGAITGQIYTKLVGTDFSLDVVAILTGAQHATFTNTVQVDLVTGSTGGLNCPGTPATIAGTTQSVNLTGGRGTTGNFNVASAYPNVRVRVRYPVASPTVTSCSTDNFAIRPTAFTVTSSNATQTGSSGAPAIKTGANFNLTAASVAGYDGTPSVDSTKVVGTPTAGTIGGSFSAAPAGTGTATGASFFYSEAGNFGLNANAVYDSSFTSVDQPGDCTADFSNALVGGKYGCSFGSTAIAQITGSSGFGRFIPDNFNVNYSATPVFATTCGTFSYVGITFSYTVTPEITVTARNGTNNGLANATTANYAGAYMKLTNTSLTPATQAARYSRFDALGGGATPALDTAGLPATTGDPAIGTFTNGVGVLAFASGTGLTYTRSATTPNAPFDADIALALNVIDTDGVAFASNPASFGAATSGNGIAFNTGKRMRYGRLAIRNANGSQLVPLQIRIEAQHWAGAPSNAFITNTADSCTTIAASDIAMSSYTNNLSGSPVCETAISGGGVLSGGRRTLVLAAPGSGNNGSVTLTVNLGASASGNTCATVGAAPGLATTANRPHLQGKWSGAAYDQNPAARATFGVYRGSDEIIHIRENY